MRAFLETSGQVGQDLLAVDWSATPLGEPEEWPPALRNAVRILLPSRFSMWMAWGPELTFFCNESYRRDTLGKKYPWALGKPASEVWSEIWVDIQPRIDRVMGTGESTWDESLQLFLERSGYLEETYHTFSYSPLADDDNVISGMLCVVKEDTREVVAARRMNTLRELGTRDNNLSEAETITAACQRLAANPWSLPFTAVYLFDDSGTSAVRAGTSGFTAEHPAAPPVIRLDDPDPVWPVGPLQEGRATDVPSLRERFDSLPTGEWPDPPESALVVPLLQPTQHAPYGFLVVGLNPYRPLDDPYRSFVHLIASQLAASITDARAYEFERQRAESLAQIDQAKTDFFTNVSHEFRTPLTLLLGPAEDALNDTADPLSPRQRERLEVVQRNGQRLLKLVNSLLDFSRLESGRVQSRFEPVDLSRYTADLATMFESAAARTGLSLTVDCAPLSGPVHVDQDHWAKIVLNLVSNALKFTFHGGITVRLREVDGEAELTVSDTGIGVPETEVPHLFDRFHRVHGARGRTHEGSGIGLALVSELAALHGGDAEAASTLGEGSTFTVRVPLGSWHLPPDQVETVARASDVAERGSTFVSEAMRWADPAAGSGPDEHAEEPEVSGAEQARGRVLVVDDNADMRDYISHLLVDHYAVDTAGDGEEALERIGAHRPDLVLTDVMMPRLDGFGLLRRLRADPASVDLPVIMLSARAGEEGTVEGLEAGADDYLVKPFSGRELLARVRVNMELDRVRRTRAVLERSQTLLDQAQRLAHLGSWEMSAEGTFIVSAQLLRILQRDDIDFDTMSYDEVISAVVVPEDQQAVVEAFTHARDSGKPTEFECRIRTGDGDVRLVAVRGEPALDDAGEVTLLRGSLQDITEQRDAERALAEAAAREESAARELAIADELQQSLLPARSFDIEHLDVATYYRAGVQGTQVGGDWYDIIELGAGRTALVVGDVMGRGVSAAAGMGQLRAAVRAFAKLDLPPHEVLEHLDSVVQDQSGDRIVTCVYAVFDSTDQTLRFANAGHLPPLLVLPSGEVQRLESSGPPLGAGYFGVPSDVVQLRRGYAVAFYTDGLVERRDRDIDVGIDQLADQLAEHATGPVAGLPELLVSALIPEGPDDDIAILVARVDAEPFAAAVSHRLGGDMSAVGRARSLVRDHLREWSIDDTVAHEVVLMASELVTNALVHGRPPLDLRVRRTDSEIVLEVQDRGAFRPRRRRAGDEDEGGRGLQIVSVLADRWGSRDTGSGKSVWASKTFNGS